MKKQEKTVTLRCDCHCSMLVCDKTVYDDGDIYFDISMQDSRYDHNFNSIWGRIKRAAKVLFGKPIYYNDVFIEEPQKFIGFVHELNKLIEDVPVAQASGEVVSSSERGVFEAEDKK
jgi:hypothetical protein